MYLSVGPFEKSAYPLVCSPVINVFLCTIQTCLSITPQILKVLCLNVFISKVIVIHFRSKVCVSAKITGCLATNDYYHDYSRRMPCRSRGRLKQIPMEKNLKCGYRFLFVRSIFYLRLSVLRKLINKKITVATTAKGRI